jgi:hypothetical protein
MISGIRRTMVALCTGAASFGVWAVPISGLYNTGVDNSNVGLAILSQDTHYSLSVVGSPAAPTNPYVGDASGSGLPFSCPSPGGCDPSFPSPWFHDTSVSKWITPTDNAGATANGSVYEYSLSFNLAGFDPTTASFSAQWMADAGGVISLNGSAISTLGTQASPDPTAYTSWHTFGASTGFLAGANTLTFDVFSRSPDNSPFLGLRVEFLASDVLTNAPPPPITTPVPEPQTYALMLAGLGFVATCTRRRRRDDR